MAVNKDSGVGVFRALKSISGRLVLAAEVATRALLVGCGALSPRLFSCLRLTCSFSEP